MTSRTKTQNSFAYPFIANLLSSATLAFPSLAGVTFILAMILAAGLSPFRPGCFRSYR